MPGCFERRGGGGAEVVCIIKSAVRDPSIYEPGVYPNVPVYPYVYLNVYPNVCPKVS